MTPTSDSKSRDPPISSTDKVAPIMMPVTNTSAIATVGSSLTKSIDNQFSSLLNDNNLTIGNQFDILHFFLKHVPIVVNGKQ